MLQAVTCKIGPKPMLEEEYMFGLGRKMRAGAGTRRHRGDAKDGARALQREEALIVVAMPVKKPGCNERVEKPRRVDAMLVQECNEPLQVMADHHHALESVLQGPDGAEHDEVNAATRQRDRDLGGSHRAQPTASPIAPTRRIDASRSVWLSCPSAHGFRGGGGSEI